jgi:hypothetical protein
VVVHLRSSVSTGSSAVIVKWVLINVILDANLFKFDLQVKLIIFVQIYL